MPKDLPRLPCAGANLRRAARAVSQLYEEALSGSGLRATQFTLLQTLQTAGALSQGELGWLLCIDSTTLSRTLRPLIKNGWIGGRQGTDKRERVFSLTDAGREKLELVTPEWRRAQRRFSRAAGGDAVALGEQLRRLASALS
jgi:DNA-binding MarR family transcriptional regulator